VTNFHCFSFHSQEVARIESFLQKWQQKSFYVISQNGRLQSFSTLSQFYYSQSEHVESSSRIALHRL